MPRRSLLLLPFTALLIEPALAQESNPPEKPNTIAADELPEVTITSPSPVVRPAKKKSASKTPRPAPAPSAIEVPQDASAGEGGDQLPLAAEALSVAPGTLLVSEDTFAPVTIATSREILSQQGASLTDTLAGRPGIAGSTFAPGSSRPIIRGLDSYRVRVQENGIGSHDVSTISEDHAVPIDPFTADRVEVIRGPATLRYGSGAIGGVVSAENQRIPTFIPPKGLSAEVKGGGASVDDSSDGAFQATAGANGFAVHADGFRRHSGDYDTPRGTVRNSFANSEGFGAGLSRVGAEGFLGISFARTESLYGVPGEEADEGVLPRIDLEQDKVQVRGEWRPRTSGIDAVRFWLGTSDYAHNELARHDGGPDFEIGSRFTNREHEGRIEVQHMPLSTSLGTLTGAAGVQLVERKTRGQSFEGESLLEPAHTTSIAGFWFEELEASQRLKLQAALRVEETRVDGFGWSNVSNSAAPVAFDGERRFLPVSTSLGLIYGLGFNTAVRVNGQYAERAPDAAELFSKGVHEATGTFEIGNPGLEKEKAYSLEAGLVRAEAPIRFDATAFVTHYQGFIYRQLTGSACAEDLASCGTPAAAAAEESFDQVLFQQRDATFYGVEIAAQYDVDRLWGGVWGIDGRYDFVHARFENGENVPRIPPHRLGAGLYWRDAAWFARAGVLHAFDQTRIGTEEIETPGYTLVSAELSYTAETSAGTRTTLGIKGDNLTDDEVLNHTSFKRREDVLLPGASVRLFGSISLN